MFQTTTDFPTSNVFLGSITHNGQLDYRMARAFYLSNSSKHGIEYCVITSSLLARACNMLWCTALNHRKKNDLQWFALLHADIVPEPLWLQKMIDIAERENADVLSAIVPIKDNDGLTSTAVAGAGPFDRLFRLTLAQVNDPNLPPTFDGEALYKHSWSNKGFFPAEVPYPISLLVNTGCMVARLDRPWCESENVYFTIRDRIIRTENGFADQVEPEDWFFSRVVQEAGARVMATREISLQHIGTQSYSSRGVWGGKYDPEYRSTN